MQRVVKVEHYDLAVDAMKCPTTISEDQLPYEEDELRPTPKLL